METNHTQGNWHAHDGQIYPEQTGATVALIPYFDKDNEQHQANSKLIAAAPDMLEALIKCRQWFDNHGKDYEIGLPNCFINAKGAIDKAL